MKIKPGYIIIFVLGVTLRLWLILSREPANDEIYGFLLAKAGFKDIWLATFADTNPPFYFLFLHVVSLVIGPCFTLFTYRIISLFFGIGGSFSLYYLARIFSQKKIARISFVISLFLPVYIWASVFARFYSFLLVLSSLSLIFFIRFCQKQQTKDFVFLATLLTLGIYTHYYFSLLFLVFVIFLFLTKRTLSKKWLPLVGLISVLHLPLFFYLFTLPKPAAPAFSNDVLKIPALIIVNITSFENLVYLFYHLSLFSYFIAVWGSLIVVILFFKGMKSWQSRWKLLLLLTIILPPFVAFLTSHLVSTLALGLNSLLIFSPALIIVLARGLWTDWTGKKVLAFLFTLYVATNLFVFWKTSVWLANFSLPYKLVRRELKDNDLVTHSNIYTFTSATYYLGRERNVGLIKTTYPYQVEKAFGYNLVPVSKVLAHQGRIWYFEPAFYNVLEAQAAKKQLDQHLKLIKWFRYPDSNINVYLYSFSGL